MNTDAARSVRRVISAVAISTCVLAVPEARPADTVISFDELAGAVDTYIEGGFEFTGGDTCVHTSCTTDGIRGMGNLEILGAPTIASVLQFPVEVGRLDGGLFDLLTVSLISVGIRPGEFQEFTFDGHHGNQQVCSFSLDLSAATPTTLVLPGCTGLDRVVAHGIDVSITTDDWVFRKIPEPEGGEPVALLALAALTPRRARRGRPMQALALGAPLWRRTGLVDARPSPNERPLVLAPSRELP